MTRVALVGAYLCLLVHEALTVGISQQGGLHYGIRAATNLGVCHLGHGAHPTKVAHTERRRQLISAIDSGTLNSSRNYGCSVKEVSGRVFVHGPYGTAASAQYAFLPQVRPGSGAISCLSKPISSPTSKGSLYSTNDRRGYGPGDIECYDKPEDLLLPGKYDLDIPQEHIEALRKILDSVDPDDKEDADEDQKHPLSDVFFRFWSTEPNDRDKMMQLNELIEKEYERTQDIAQTCKNLNLPPPKSVKKELAMAMLREMFNRRVTPKSYIQSLMEELGVNKLKELIQPPPPKESDSKWRFGIELTDPNREIEPLSENALRGYLGLPYYEHLKNMANIHPENARRILTIIHRIYDPPILFVDLHPSREPSDHELLEDSENLKKAQCNAFKKFIDTYPDLKWPVDDESFLDIYNLWYPEDRAGEVNTLPRLMEQSYGPGTDLSTPNFYYRFLFIPAVSCTAGLTTGLLLQRGISTLAGFIGGINLQIMVESFFGQKLCSAAVALLTWVTMSKDMSVKGDLFSVALKNLVQNGLKDPQRLLAAAYSGLKPKDEVLRDIERFVVGCTLTAFHRALRLSRDGKGIDTWNRLTRQVRRVAEVCLPICGVSVYRIMYTVACDLAISDDLPAAVGDEVHGSSISGDQEDPIDDYSGTEIEGFKKLGLPPPNKARYERNAMLLTTFCLQAFSGMKGFRRVSEEDINGFEEFKRNVRELGVSDEAWDNIKEDDIMPSTIYDVEKFAREMEKTNGKFQRINLEREYGFDPLNDFMGETEEEKTRRMQIELQEARDALMDLSPKREYKLEMVKALSIIMYVREEWLLEKYISFFKKQCTDFIAAEIENMSGKIEEKIQKFNISPKYNEEIKTDAMFLVAGKLQNSGDLSLERMLEMAHVSEVPEDVALDAYNFAVFPKIREELSSWDLTTVTAEMIQEIKERYRCRDLVLINALSEVIKKFASESKKEMINSRNKLNWNLVEKHMSALLRARNAVVNAAASTIDCKLWYRIERAFRFNKPYLEHEFTREEIVGTGTVKRLPNADWELSDPPPKKSDLQIAEEEWEADLKDLKPLEITGEDNQTPIHHQMLISTKVAKGELSPEFECLPTDLYAGTKPKDPDYELEQELPKDEFELYRPIMDSQYAYSCWIVYCYRKRAVSKEDVKTVLTIFPFLEKLVERSETDWRRLYARQRLRQKDSLGSKVNWEEELDCDRQTAEEICSIAYEEDLLKRTGAFVEHIEEDIGDVRDTYFNPFDPSIYNRLNYLYSENIPSELEMENIKKVQEFFNLSTEKIQEIHTKCFSFALDQYCAKLLKETPQDWPEEVERQARPLGKRLLIAEEPFNMIVSKAEYDYLTREANRLMMQRQPCAEFLERAEFIVEEFKRLKVMQVIDGKPKLKFTIRAQTEGVMEEIMSAFMISHCDLYGKVDQAKLDEFCTVYGLIREKRKEMLNKLGRQFYHKFLSNFKEEDLTIDCLKEVEHLNRPYEFNESDTERLFYNHLGYRIREWYDPDSGLEDMKRLVAILHGEEFSKIIPFERSRRIHWFINIINDCMDVGEDKEDTRVFTYTPDEFFDLKFDGGEGGFDSLQGIFNLSSRILTLSAEEYREARLIAAEEIGATEMTKIQQLLKAKDGIYAADQQMSKFLRAMSLAPEGTLPTIKKQLTDIKDYESLRRLVMLLPCSDATLAKGIKIIDALEKA